MIYALVNKRTGEVVEIFHDKEIDPTTPTKPDYVWAPYEVVTELIASTDDHSKEAPVRSFVEGKLIDTVVIRDATEEEVISRVSPLYRALFDVSNEVKKLSGKKPLSEEEYTSFIKEVNSAPTASLSKAKK